MHVDSTATVGSVCWGGLRVSGSRKKGSSVDAVVGRVQRSVCFWWHTTHPGHMHLSIPCPFLSPTFLSLCQWEYTRRLCLQVRIWYLKPRPSAPPLHYSCTPQQDLVSASAHYFPPQIITYTIVVYCTTQTASLRHCAYYKGFSPRKHI